MREILTVCLMRPIRILSEPVVLFTNLFLLYQCSVYFLTFGEYAIIFTG